MNRIPIEDNFCDVITKAQFGQKISNTTLASRAGITLEQLRAAKNGTVDDAVIRAVAPVLQLRADALVELAHHRWYPEVTAPSDGFAMFTTPFRDDMTVNNFLVWDPVTHDAAAFDTGTRITEMLTVIREKNLTVRAIFITHTHTDHIAALDELAEMTHAPIFSSEREPVTHPAAKTFAEHATFSIGNLALETRCTWGHSPGQTTYVVNGLSQPLAIVGDALFCGSMGGCTKFYNEQRANNAEKILSLADDTIIASGHGPLTTVGFEKEHNPFVVF